MTDRMTNEQLKIILTNNGYKVTSSRREGPVELGRDKKPLAMRRVTVTVPGSKWSLAVGDWCQKKKQQANERRVLDELKSIIGKEGVFDLCDHDMGHSSEGDKADDAFVDFYVYTSN